MSDKKNIFDGLREKIVAVKENFAEHEWKDKLEDIARDARKIVQDATEAGHIHGFVIELNGVDASTHRSFWPEIVREKDALVVKVSVAFLDETKHIEFGIGKNVEVEVAPELSADEPASEQVEDAKEEIEDKDAE